MQKYISLFSRLLALGGGLALPFNDFWLRALLFVLIIGLDIYEVRSGVNKRDRISVYFLCGVIVAYMAKLIW